MIVFVLLLALPILFILYFTHKTQSPTNEPPGPTGLPLIGNLHQFDAKLPHLYLYRLSKHYGSLFSLKLGFRRVVVISSADLVKEVMKSYDVEFSSRPVLVGLQKLSYNGLDVAFSQYNETWREMRKIATVHLFSLKKLQFFHPICKDEVSKMVKKIALDASLSRVTNLSEMIVSLANNSICRMVIGKTYGSEDQIQKSLISLLLEAQIVMGGFFVEDFLPLYKWIDYLTGMKTKMERNVSELDCLYEELISEHLNPNRPKSMEGDVLDTLLQLKRNGASSVDLTMDPIKALLMNMISGGTDTVSTAIIWALTALINNPLVMTKVQTELRDSFGENKDLIHEEEDVAKLPYLKAVIKETLRLYPPAPLLPPRETMKKCSLSGYDIKAGTMVYINAWAIGRDPEKWKNPDKFWPERFLESDVDVRGRDPEVIPFGIGRRGCPGISIAMLEMEMCLANVLYKFDWELPDGVEDVDFDTWPGMTMHKKNDLLVLPKYVIA